ncbi:hypothetical protein PPEP_b1156 [Pseudoalteromonas peptidolytica F12-50-A1]|uniref:Uncharacterized protein n=1 Tax=Pseudoalteromonas peptidolytica F12-50-A1 TaxID=1315280 RepID=A0A8I0MZZ3_9GAMM|nr:hypothetical protein [Pseudoalteromonas peptidolytica F12-50-A1]
MLVKWGEHNPQGLSALFIQPQVNYVNSAIDLTCYFKSNELTLSFVF